MKAHTETHTPTHWIKEVNGSTTRTLEEVAYYAGPNEPLVIRAVNAHEALLEIVKHLYHFGVRKQASAVSFSTLMDNNDTLREAVENAIAQAEALS